MRVVRRAVRSTATILVVLVALACSTPEPVIDGSPDPQSVSAFDGEWGRAATSLGGSELAPLLVPFDDRLFVLFTQNGGSTVAGEIYDPASGTVDGLAESDHVWRYNPAVAWTGSELLVVGGSSGPAIDHLVLSYDPEAGRWRVYPNPPADVDGGETSVGGPGVWTGDELVMWQDGLAFNPANQTWRTLAPYPGPRRAFPATAWSGDEIVVWGGCDASIPQCDDLGQGLLNDGVIYNVEADAWRAMARSPLAFGIHPVAAEADGVVLFYAGNTGTGSDEVQAARYDLATDEWAALDTPPVEPRRYAAAAWTGRHFVIWGGEGAGGIWLGDGAALDPTTGVWQLLPEPPPRSARDRHAMAWAGDHLYIVGGWETNGPITFTPGY